MLLIGLVLYVVLQFAIGVWVSRRTATESDYILAGRSLGRGLIAFSVFATWFGAEAIVATTGEVYRNGLAGALIDPVAYAVSVMAAGLMLAGLLWRRGLTTFADLFAQRYSPFVAKLVVLALLPGSIFWAAAQVRAFGQVLGESSGLSLPAAITIAAVLVGAYTTIGGLLADAVTDFVQSLVVIGGLLVLAVVVATHLGGPGAVLAAVEPQRLTLFAGSEGGGLEQAEHIVVALCGSLVAVELISRYLGARTDAVARDGTVAGGAIYLAVGLLPVFLGLAAAVAARHDAALAAKLGDSERIVATLAEHYLPTAGFVIFTGAIVSAILSNVHSSLHAPASQLSHNVFATWLPGLDGAGKLRLVRATVLGLSLAAFGLALAAERIKDLVEMASAFGSAGVFVATCFALFTRTGGPDAAAGSIIGGVVLWLAGRFALGWSAPYMAAIAGSAAVYLAIAWWQGRERDASDVADEAIR